MMAFHDSSYPIQSTPKYINPNRICQLPDSFRTASNLSRQKSLTNIAAPHKQPERSTREILNRIEDHWIQLPLPPPPPQMPQFARRNVPRPPLNSRNVKPLPKNENRILRRSATTNSVGGVYPLCTFDILTRKNLEFENKILQPQPPPQAPPPKPPKHLAAKIPPQLKNQQQLPTIQRHQYETSRSAKSLSFHHQPPLDTTSPIYRQQQPLVNYPRMQNKSASSVLTSMNQSRFNNQNAIYSANRQIIINEKRARFKVENNQYYPPHNPHVVNPHHLQLSPSLAEFRRQSSFDSPSSSFDRSNSRLQNTAAVDTNLNPPNKRFQPISTLIRTLPKWFFENELVKSHRYHMSKYHMY